MRIALVGLSLLAACGTSPRADFDSGVTVHFLMIRERPPKDDVTLKPVFTVGDAVVRAPAITFGPDHALAQEAAVVRVRRDKKARISFWDPMTRTGARDTADARHEMWVVVDLAQLGGEAALDFHRTPPNRDLQEWTPLAEISD
ncbi:MAG: hypothetical protein ACYS0E_23200 [Planctomycetota bacterium]